MKQRLYIETTIPSYLTSRPSRDLIDAARQEITREWWDTRRHDFELYVSQFVLDEAGDGDPDAARLRLVLLEGLPPLETTPPVTALANEFTDRGLLPRKAIVDAFHIALAAVHQIDILLTWNCAHLANASIQGRLGRLIQANGYQPPVICTPETLMGE